jgi:hypothetical protein
MMSIPQTSNSSLVPYVSAIQTFGFFSQKVIADMLKANTDSPRPSYLACIDPNNYFGRKWLQHIGFGAGEIESAVVVASRYTPADLMNLTGVSQILLQGLNAARALWSAYKILKPGTARPEECPAARESFEMLTQLRDGEKLFSFQESEKAGLVAVIPPNPYALAPGQSTIVPRLVRLFPTYGINSLLNRGGYNRGGDC